MQKLTNTGFDIGMSIDIAQLIARMEWACARNLSELAFITDGLCVTLLREPSSLQRDSTAAAAHPEPLAPDADTLNAPLGGVCHLNSEAGGDPYVAVGDKVTAGQTVCVIEAMKVMTSVTAAKSGTVQAVLVDSGAQVEADAPLMRIA